MISFLKNLMHKSANLLGFDIVSSKNLEEEIRRRERERERLKAKRLLQLREAQTDSRPGASAGQRIAVEREHLEIEAGRLLRPVSVVLDIGCAFRPQQYLEASVHICCEPFPQYMDRLMVETEGDSKYVYLNCELGEICRILPARSVDTVFMLDVIEHIDKPAGTAALEKLKRIARSQVVIFTPMGFMEQEPTENGVDQWGMGGDEWQRHRSGWVPEDFSTEDGWTTVACADFFADDAYGRPLAEPVGAFWAIWSAH